MNTKNKWEKHYRTCQDEFPQAADVLLNHQHLLPLTGIALDLACGRGANALCLAKQGLNVTAWDISESALKRLSDKAEQENLSVDCAVRDVSEKPPEPDSFDVIVVSRFLDRTIIKNIKNAIRPNGLIFYQTFTKDKVHATGPDKPDYLLDSNELLGFFRGWRIIHYREEGRVGRLSQGFRNQALLIAKNERLT